jgi:hypothetical protein
MNFKSLATASLALILVATASRAVAQNTMVTTPTASTASSDDSASTRLAPWPIVGPHQDAQIKNMPTDKHLLANKFLKGISCVQAELNEY